MAQKEISVYEGIITSTQSVTEIDRANSAIDGVLLFDLLQTYFGKNIRLTIEVMG